MTEEPLPSHRLLSAVLSVAAAGICYFLFICLVIWQAHSSARLSLGSLATGQVGGLLLPGLYFAAGLRRRGFLPPASRILPKRAALAPLAGMAVSATFVASALTQIWISLLRAISPGTLDAAAARATSQMDSILHAHGPLAELNAFVMGAFLAATCEELVFRGILQRGLRQALPTGTALALTAVVFSLAHGELLGAPARMFLGLSLGWCLEATGGLGAGVLAHAFNNTLILGIFYATGGNERPQDLTADPLAPALGRAALPAWCVITVVTAVGWIACARWLARRSAPRPAEPLPGSEPA